MSRPPTLAQLSSACLLALAACGGSSIAPAAPTTDGGLPPASVDAGSGTPDAGTPDAGSPDAGSGGGSPDAGSPGPTQFTLNVVVNGAGRVTSAPAGIDCGTTCAALFAAGTSVTLMPAPGDHASFAGWGGGCTGPGGCTVKADATVYATFVTSDPPPPPPPPPPPAQCQALAPSDAPVQQYVHAPFEGFCGGGLGDAHGILDFYVQHETGSRGDHGIYLDFVTTDNRFLSEQPAGTGRGLTSALEQPNGVAAVTYSGWPGYIWQVTNYNGAGGGPYAEYQFRGTDVVRVGDPNGQVLIAGQITFDLTAGAPTQNIARMYEENGGPGTTRWGPTKLASGGAVVGAGVDAHSRALIITDGSAKFGAGSISAQWFDANGAALTGEFSLLAGFVPGSSTYLEVAQLIADGVAIRRVDNGSEATAHGQWLVTLASGATAAQSAPAWMIARNNTRLQIARGGQAYAVLPDGARGTACTQRVEIVAADGTVCGARDYPLAAGRCDTNDLTMSLEGTIIQQLPLSLETTSAVSGQHTCTWRWWVGAAR